ncbi:substrate-binding periplasmic protein [Aquipseudomonas campi]
MMPRLIFTALLTFLCCAGAVAQTSPVPLTVNVGYYEFPPYSWTDRDGTPRGSVLELTDRLLRHAGYQGHYRSLPGARLYAGLQDGSIQLWPGAGGKAELAEHTLESRNLIGEFNLALYYRPDTPPPDIPDGLVGGRLILINGYSYWKAINELIESPALGLELHRTNTHAAALEMLLRKRGDYLLDYQTPVEQNRQRLGIEPLPFIVLQRLQSRFIVSRHTPGSEALVEALDRAYEELGADQLRINID